MSDLSPQRGRRLSRREREARAYRLVMVGGAAGVVVVLGVVLAALDLIGATIPILAVLVVVVCRLWFRRTVSG